MDSMKLSEYLNGYASKKLVAVDLPGLGSNQREINGVSSLRELLGGARLRGTVQWNYMLDEREDSITEAGEFTFYDARENHETRTEWRFYYSPNAIMATARPDDLLVILRVKGRPESELYGFVFPAHTSWEQKASILFGAFDVRVGVQGVEALERRGVDLAESTLLEMLGLGRQESEADIEALANARFPTDTFPSTRELATFARESLVSPGEMDFDSKLTAWLKREAQIFYAIEKRIVGAQISRPGAFPNVEEFIRYSLSVQNRRKSRMGWSFEHHLHELFSQAGLKFDHPGLTEGKSRPDFLFPGTAEYHDSGFDRGALRMLGAKATCKDRWRQVLAEAKRISQTHVCTLEPAISVTQTNEMKRNSVVLVAPVHVFNTYTREQRGNMLTVSGFISELRDLQSKE